MIFIESVYIPNGFAGFYPKIWCILTVWSEWFSVFVNVNYLSLQVFYLS